MFKLILPIIFFSCTDLILKDSVEYHSIQLNGGAWININNDIDNQNDLSLMDNNFTLEFWFTGGISNTSEALCLVSIIDSIGTIKFGVFKDPTTPNYLDIWLDDTQLESIFLDLESDLNNNSNFHHIAITSKEDIQFYFNGLLVKTYQGQNIKIDDNDLTLGGKVNRQMTTLGNFWIGNFDEIRLWTSVLSESLIDFHIKNPDKLVESAVDENGNNWWETNPLIGLWRFELPKNYNSPIVIDESCQLLNSSYSFTQSCVENNAIIYTLQNNVAIFSEKHP